MSHVNDASRDTNLFEIARDDELLDVLGARLFDADESNADTNIDASTYESDDVAHMLAAWAQDIDDEAEATFTVEPRRVTRAARAAYSVSDEAESVEPGPVTAAPRPRGGTYSASGDGRVAAALGRGWWGLAPAARVRTGATAAAAGLVLSLSGVAAAVGGGRLPSLDSLTLSSTKAHNPSVLADEVPRATATDAPAAPQKPAKKRVEALPDRTDGHAEGAARPRTSAAPKETAPSDSWPRVEERRTGLDRSVVAAPRIDRQRPAVPTYRPNTGTRPTQAPSTTRPPRPTTPPSPSSTQPPTTTKPSTSSTPGSSTTSPSTGPSGSTGTSGSSSSSGSPSTTKPTPRPTSSVSPRSTRGSHKASSGSGALTKAEKETRNRFRYLMPRPSIEASSTPLEPSATAEPVPNETATPTR